MFQSHHHRRMATMIEANLVKRRRREKIFEIVKIVVILCIAGVIAYQLGRGLAFLSI